MFFVPEFNGVSKRLGELWSTYGKWADSDEDESNGHIVPHSNSDRAGDVDVSGPSSDLLLMGIKQPSLDLLENAKKKIVLKNGKLVRINAVITFILISVLHLLYEMRVVVLANMLRAFIAPQPIFGTFQNCCVKLVVVHALVEPNAQHFPRSVLQLLRHF